MTADSPLQIVVVDDVSRFALHLWRYLAETPGFGIGGYSSNDHEEFFRRNLGRRTASRTRVPRSLSVPHGDAEVWWVEARGQRWRKELGAVLDRIRGDLGDLPRALFLVDIRGARDRRHLFKAEEVVGFLEESWPGASAWTGDAREPAAGKYMLISSYRRRVRVDGRTIPVYSKTSATFEREIVRKALRRPRASDQLAVPKARRHQIESAGDAVQPASDSRWRHVLITGAGFELGMASLQPRRLSFGLPSTREIVKNALEVTFDESQIDDGRGYKLPFLSPYRRHAAAAGLKRAAKDGDLDRYWDELLALELQKHQPEDRTQRPVGKIEGFRREFELREAFRDAMVQNDWGHLQQAIGVVKWPFFDTWLTTNYTRFANRAIQLMNTGPAERRAADATDTGAGQAHRRWRIVATSNEATRHLQELLHWEHEPNASVRRGGAVDRSGRRAEGEGTRYLFKLHGDIPHVTTMALAGHDKEVSSPLSVPIDSLHLLYLVAERHLETEILPREEPVLWHVIGHGFWDRPLKRLIRRVVRLRGPKRHFLLLVDPGLVNDRKKPSPWIRLLESLPWAGDEEAPWTVFCVRAPGDLYVSRLERRDAGTGPTAGWTAGASEGDPVAMRRSIVDWLRRLRFQHEGKLWRSVKPGSIRGVVASCQVSWWHPR